MASEALAQQAVENVVENSRESGSEPPSIIITGLGATDSPHDGGNLPETVTQPGVEPMSNQKGAGIAGDLYDRGNGPGTHPPLAGISNSVDNTPRTRPDPRRSVTSPDMMIQLLTFVSRIREG
jgi:hypothetical protein